MRRFLSGTGIIALTLGVAMGPAASSFGITDETRVTSTSTTIGASPFDEFPGFGRSVEGSLRDDTIALWETFRRETIVRTCMSDAGFEYAIDVAYPPEAVIEVARRLGVQPEQREDVQDDFNQEFVASLNAEDADRYYRTLLDETSAALQSFEASEGLVPEGSNPASFAAGGCKGRATSAIAGVWSARRSIEADLAGLRAQVSRAARPAYQACVAGLDVAVDDPASLETKLNQTGLNNPWSLALREALGRCDSVWRTAYHAAEAALSNGLIEANKAMFDRHSELYSDAANVISADQEFLSFLSREAGEAASDLATDHNHSS